MTSPIIFIGMHRSGTSILSKTLENIGLFTGKKKDENNESLFFLELNNWLMSQCAARWDQPKPMDILWEKDNIEIFNHSKNYLKFILDSPRIIKYLGLRNYVENNSIFNLNKSWGWKDPRNTFTLPIWLEIFPDAKVIVIERHGIDVALSLKKRAEFSINEAQNKFKAFKKITPFYPLKRGFSTSCHCLSVDGAFSLWEDYQEQLIKVTSNIPLNQIKVVKYENFLNEPQDILLNLSKFCLLDSDTNKIELACQNINPQRAYSYKNDLESSDFEHIYNERLSKFGY